MGIDVAAARRDTPGATEVAHLNNAGAALPPRQVVDRQIRHLRLEAAIGGYEAADRAAHDLARTYDTVAGLIGAGPGEIALVENATRAWDMAFYAFDFGAGDRIITARSEYASGAIALLQTAARTGATIEVVPDDEHGQIDVAALESMIDERVKLVAITHVPTQSGLVNPVEAVGALTRRAGVPYLVDACQSVGQLPVDVTAIGCDILSATGRKWLRGPRGTGFLYVRAPLAERLVPPFLDLRAADWVAPDRYEVRGDARRFETWERNVAATIALGTAVDYARSLGLAAIAERVGELAHSLRCGLDEVDGVTVRDRGLTLCGIVTFTVDGVAEDEVRSRLSSPRINVSVSPAASARFDLDARGLDAVVRASPHYYNTSEEIERLVACVAETARATRR